MEGGEEGRRGRVNESVGMFLFANGGMFGRDSIASVCRVVPLCSGSVCVSSGMIRFLGNWRF